jgi:hypothetical protein
MLCLSLSYFHRYLLQTLSTFGSLVIEGDFLSSVVQEAPGPMEQTTVVEI